MSHTISLGDMFLRSDKYGHFFIVIIVIIRSYIYRPADIKNRIYKCPFFKWTGEELKTGREVRKD